MNIVATPPADEDRILLTSSQVRRMKQERADLADLRARIERELALLDERLRAAAILQGLTLPALLADGEPAAAEPITDAIKRVLGSERMTRTQIRAELMKEPVFRDRLIRSPNIFYNAIIRLVRRRDLVEANERLHVPQAP